ncbi:terpene synthase 10-like protein isoform X1 [Cinnamomum micranthum f. kanehirae]|uniref:Terpene synthase 10-like protein isoform X1 n=1 Tax=Cinnamomum micranthum f. kanehirae TaxID=337451 RepID=A0A3S3P047_9MAGN|nr:terpene synthase 10-like protein isoform X1 [Cinnamomum micranthum f. kanehirae]
MERRDGNRYKEIRPLNCIPSSVIYEPEVSRRRANYKPNIWDHDLLQSLRSDYQVSHSSIKTSLSLPKINRPLNCLPSSVIYEPEVSRRRANYKPNIWDHDLIQSLRSDYQDEAYAKRAEKLKEDVKHCMLQEAANPLAQLELIDPIQRLGMGHIFDKEIKGALNIIWEGHNKNDNKGGLGDNYDLYATSLLFRLLREHGYHVSQDVFNKFKDEGGGLITSVTEDINGILSLYEASHLAYQGETLLLECRTFTCTYLKAIKESVDIMLANKLGHALELPLHWRTQRLEALWYLNIYENEENMNPTLLELAKLDFNMVQATHQRDLRKASSWWSSLGLGGKLSFSRDRITECFFLALGVMFEPQFGYPRVELAKVCQLITTIDDIYDVFGSLDELECFTDAVDRWDIKSIDRLPEYMKICFLALYNTTNQMGYEILKDQGINIIPYLQKAWADLCKAMLVESKWYYSGYKPSLEEYLNNGWVSSSGPVILVHAFLLSKQPIATQKLNEEVRTASPYPPHFINSALNLARVVHCIYQHGDGHTVQDRSTKDRLTSLLAQPIPLVVE